MNNHTSSNQASQPNNESASPTTKKPRRVKGDGGFTKPRQKDGFIRGYKNIDGTRAYTRWMPNPVAAAKALRELEAMVAEKAELAAERAAAAQARPAQTVGDAIKEFIETTELSQTTISGYRYSASHYLTELLDRQVAELPRPDVVEHYTALAKRGLSKATIRNASAILRNGLAYAADHGWKPADDAVGIKLPKAPVKIVKALKDAERIRLEAAMIGHRHEARYLFALRFAARPAEVTGLAWRHIDFEANTIRIEAQLQHSTLLVGDKQLGLVYATRVKTPTSRRTIPVGPRVMNLLRDWKIQQAEEAKSFMPSAALLEQRRAHAFRLEMAKSLGLLADPDNYLPLPDDLVFTQQNGEPLTPTHDRDAFAALVKAAGIDSKPSLYVMRHTAITHMLKTGKTLLDVSLLAGHRSTAFTQTRYGVEVPIPQDIGSGFDD